MGVGLKGHAYCNWRPHRATGDLPDRQTTCQISLRLTPPWFGFTHIQEKHSILSQRSLSRPTDAVVATLLGRNRGHLERYQPSTNRAVTIRQTNMSCQSL